MRAEFARVEWLAILFTAGMGVGLPAAVGAKIARPERPVVCLSGDGGLLMCIHELATVTQEDLDITLVVSNNSDYAVISKQLANTETPAFAWDSPDYATVAEGFGWAAESVADEAGLASAMDAALARDGPTLIDVDVPTGEPSAAEAADFESHVEM